MSVGAWIGVGVAVLVVIAVIAIVAWYINCYNTFIRLKNNYEEAFSTMDVQMQKRYDLIPNLVATVKGYASHEEKVFSEITKLRKQAIEATDEAQKLEYANAIVPKMRNIIAIAENYPQLKADALFKSLMDELVLVEDKIVASRRFYDSNVNLYNTALERRNKLTFKAKTLDELDKIMSRQPGFVYAPWCGSTECEMKVKEVKGTKSRCITAEHVCSDDKCLVCGKKAKHIVVWGIQY